jgi:hypothetical protein
MEVEDMTEGINTKGEVTPGMGLDEKTIELLHSLNPENFAEFRDKIDILLLNERSIITFCTAS